MATIFKNARGWIAVFFAASLLAACGGGSSTADTTPPTVSAFSVKNGAAISANSDASYAVSGNLGTTQEYTVTFSEKLDATSYTVKMLDTNNSPVALPTGMTATIAANDATNLAYTLTITTSGSFAFDAGQTSKAVKLQTTVADASHNAATVNVTETVGDIAPIAGGAFASLADMTISDQAGGPIIPVNAGGVTDSLGRTIIYSATGLPTGLSINTSTGVISGAYDAFGNTPFTVTVKAQVSGGTLSIQKTFILTVRDDG
jgi:Putative Ig domain